MRVGKNEVPCSQAWEETFFLGLRLNAGVDLQQVFERFGRVKADSAREIIRELVELRLAELEGDRVCLSRRGRLVSNEVFEKFVSDTVSK
jgi:oxygen-independent coproporphyrinogen-3 oxidase